MKIVFTIIFLIGIFSIQRGFSQNGTMPVIPDPRISIHYANQADYTRDMEVNKQYILYLNFQLNNSYEIVRNLNPESNYQPIDSTTFDVLNFSGKRDKTQDLKIKPSQNGVDTDEIILYSEMKLETLFKAYKQNYQY